MRANNIGNENESIELIPVIKATTEMVSIDMQVVIEVLSERSNDWKTLILTSSE
jgi:hypothetical protein